ncbi:MAG: tyrosine recombinase XerD, partial [Chloroflexi bacterium]
MEELLGAFLEYLQQEFNYSYNTTAAYKNDLSQFVRFLDNGYSQIENWSEV